MTVHFEPDRVRQLREGREIEGVGCFIAAVVASAFGLRSKAILDPARGCASAAFARHAAIYLAQTRLGLSYAAAGRLFGRDRTTARHACQLVEERREDVAMDSILDCLERALGLWLRTRRGA